MSEPWPPRASLIILQRGGKWPQCAVCAGRSEFAIFMAAWPWYCCARCAGVLRQTIEQGEALLAARAKLEAAYG